MEVALEIRDTGPDSDSIVRVQLSQSSRDMIVSSAANPSPEGQQLAPS